MAQLDSPGKATLDTVGKTPTGAQSKGAVDVKLYVNVDTGKGGGTTIDTQFDPAFGRVPSGAKTGGL